MDYNIDLNGTELTTGNKTQNPKKKNEQGIEFAHVLMERRGDVS